MQFAALTSRGGGMLPKFQFQPLTTSHAAIIGVRTSHKGAARKGDRRQVMGLNEFNDHMLDDIGLSRDDVRFALRGGPFDDHSTDLMRAALRRRSRLTLL